MPQIGMFKDIYFFNYLNLFLYLVTNNFIFIFQTCTIVQVVHVHCTEKYSLN